MKAHSPKRVRARPPITHRRTEHAFGERSPVQALADASGRTRAAMAYQQLADAGRSSTGGELLQSDVRTKMERAFGADFSGVRVHQSGYAGVLGAAALTRGSHIHFAPGVYRPRERRGQEILGHELAHVVQQSSGRVRATGELAGVPINDSSTLEHEADRMGARAARGQRVELGGAGAAGSAASPVAQRLVASIPGGDWTEKGGPKDDKTFINTTLTAHAKVGGKIKRIDHVNFAADFEHADTEDLALTGHGKPGGIGDKSAKQVADYLTDADTGLDSSQWIPATIHLENCYAGAAAGDGSTVISTLETELSSHLGGAHNVPRLIGPVGPQITTNLEMHGIGTDIIKTVVDSDKTGSKFKMACLVQHCLYTQYFNAGEKVSTGLDGGDAGQKFLQIARADQVFVSRLKQIFVKVVEGAPLSKEAYDQIQPGLQKKLSNYWNRKGFNVQTGKSGDDIFKTGVDMRDSTGLVTIDPPPAPVEHVDADAPAAAPQVTISSLFSALWAKMVG